MKAEPETYSRAAVPILFALISLWLFFWRLCYKTGVGCFNSFINKPQWMESLLRNPSIQEGLEIKLRDDEVAVGHRADVVAEWLALFHQCSSHNLVSGGYGVPLEE